MLSHFLEDSQSNNNNGTEINCCITLCADVPFEVWVCGLVCGKSPKVFLVMG